MNPKSVVIPRVSKLQPLNPEGRPVGTTTALALQYIAQAIKLPNTWICIKDHHENGDFALLSTVQQSVTNLDLKFFRYRLRENNYQIRCDIFQEPYDVWSQ